MGRLDPFVVVLEHLALLESVLAVERDGFLVADLHVEKHLVDFGVFRRGGNHLLQEL